MRSDLIEKTGVIRDRELIAGTVTGHILCVVHEDMCD